MDDTKSLLMMVLHKIFQNHPKTIENTFQLIHSFNNGKIEKGNYEKTLKSICDLMNDQLPSSILVYILTLVDMPENCESQSQIVEKMKKTHDHLPEMNVRPHLLQYLNNAKQPNLKPQADGDQLHNNFPKPATKVLRKSRKLLVKRPEPPKSLLDICANYVVTNDENLKKMYKKKHAKIWRLINSNTCSESQLKQCYKVVKDLNKKNKLLREIESDNLSLEVFLDEYKDSEFFVRTCPLFSLPDPFEPSPEIEAVINKMFAI